MHSEYIYASLIILASNDAFMQFMKEEYPISKESSSDDRVNIAEFAAVKAKIKL